MAKFIPDNDPNIRKQDAIIIYQVAEEWRDNCLLGDGSIFFTGENLWTKENFMNGIQKYWIDKKIQAKEDFWQKLNIQFQDAPDEIKKLMAEIIWFLKLADFGAITKNTFDKIRESIFVDLSDIPPYNKISRGIGSAGQGYKTGFWRELTAFILFMQQWKRLLPEQHTKLSKDCWILSNQYRMWCYGFNKKYKIFGDFNNRQFRHILFNLIFPDQFERIFSGSDKEEIIKAFAEKNNINKMSWTEKDKKILEIRTQLEEKYGESCDVIDFYWPPFNKMWNCKYEHSPKT